jgi:hypothetical protein
MVIKASREYAAEITPEGNMSVRDKINAAIQEVVDAGFNNHEMCIVLTKAEAEIIEAARRQSEFGQMFYPAVNSNTRLLWNIPVEIIED